MGSGLSLLFTLNSTHSRIFDTSGFSARNFLCRRRFGRSQIRRAFCGCEPRLANIEIQGQAYLVHRRIRPPFYISEAKPILLVSESPLRRGIRRYGLRPDTSRPLQRSGPDTESSTVARQQPGHGCTTMPATGPCPFLAMTRSGALYSDRQRRIRSRTTLLCPTVRRPHEKTFAARLRPAPSRPAIRRTPPALTKKE